MQNKKVIYTAIFGGKDDLHKPEFLPLGFDFVCFTDNKNLKSKYWDVRFVEPQFSDPVRNARYYKIMTHKVLQEYDVSVWIDGNMILVGDVFSWVKKYLSKNNFATFNHFQQKKRFLKLFWIRDKELARDCIYEEAKDLLLKNQRGFFMDDSETIQKQIERYQKEGYPAHYGLAVTMILLRNHMKQDCITLMEAWWNELSSGSRRDQLSLNYVAWKQNYPITYIQGDPRYNSYFKKTKHKNKKNFNLKNV